MRPVGGIEYQLTLLENLLGLAVMDHGRSKQADARVPMLIVVPREEKLRMEAAVLDATEAVWEIGPVFHSAELTFRIRVVIGNIGTAMSLGDSEIGE